MNNKRETRGMSVTTLFTILLTIAFIVLKLCGVISWRWLWVLAPLWIDAALIVSIFLFTIILSGIIALVEYRRERKQSREEKDKNAQ